jgi:hypothetical protein
MDVVVRSGRARKEPSMKPTRGKELLLKKVTQLELFTKKCFSLDGYNPGDGRRYQMILWDNEAKPLRFYPRNAHWKSRDFKSYLEGFLDGYEEAQQEIPKRKLAFPPTPPQDLNR